MCTLCGRSEASSDWSFILPHTQTPRLPLLPVVPGFLISKVTPSRPEDPLPGGRQFALQRQMRATSGLSLAKKKVKSVRSVKITTLGPVIMSQQLGRLSRLFISSENFRGSFPAHCFGRSYFLFLLRIKHFLPGPSSEAPAVCLLPVLRVTRPGRAELG